MLRVVSVNIEGEKHLESVADFLRAEQPDVLCLQEVLETDVPFFASIIGEAVLFVPMKQKEGQIEGIAMISRYPMKAREQQYAGVVGGDLPLYDKTSYESKVLTQRYSLLTAVITTDESEYRICTTHMPVTEGGQVTEYQIAAVNALIKELDSIGEFVLLGDLNAPRGEPSFALFSERYRDNVPEHYDSSLDPVLHRAAPLKKMVDGCFSTDAYTVKQTRFQCGISDHCALCVEVSK